MVLKSFYIKHTTLIINTLLSNKHYLTLTKDQISLTEPINYVIFLLA